MVGARDDDCTIRMPADPASDALSSELERPRDLQARRLVQEPRRSAGQDVLSGANLQVIHPFLFVPSTARHDDWYEAIRANQHPRSCGR